MRLRLEAQPGELEKAAPALLAKLGRAISPHAPDVAAVLDRAANQALGLPPEPRDEVLKELLAQTRALYAVQTKDMLDEIGQALDEHVAEQVEDVRKSEGWDLWDDLLRKDQGTGRAGPYIGPQGGKWADAAHTIHWDAEAHGPPSGQSSGQGKTRVTVHNPGEAAPEGVKWGNHPGPGYHSTLNFKGKDYQVQFGHKEGKFAGTLKLPNGDTHHITSPNHAANMVMLHSKGLDPTLNSYELKKLGIAYPAARLFRFGETPAEAAKPEPPPEPKVTEPPKPAPTPDRKGLGLMGRAAPLYVPSTSGPPTKQQARYALVEAEDLVPSHRPKEGFLAHPAYPQGVQERRYDRDTAEQLKVHGVAQQLNPEIVFTPSVDAINGPPVVTEDGVVLGGNGRSMALQLHYGQEDAKAAETRAFLREHAGVYGFKAEDVQKLKNPVVVRVVETPSKDTKSLATLVRRYNESSSQGMDAKASAVGEARRMNEESMGHLSNIPEDSTLNEFLGTKESKPFVDSLRSSGILNQRNASALLSEDGLLNDDGRQMVGRILTAAIIPEPNLLEDIGGNLRTTLARSAPYVLAAGADSDPEWDLRPAIQAAARDVVRAKAQGATKLEEYLDQGSLFGDRKATDGVPLGSEMLRLMWDAGGKPLVFSKVMRGYLQAARQNPRGQASLFAQDKQSPAEVLSGLTAKLHKGGDPDQVLDSAEWYALARDAVVRGQVLPERDACLS